MALQIVHAQHRGLIDRISSQTEAKCAGNATQSVEIQNSKNDGEELLDRSTIFARRYACSRRWRDAAFANKV
jgi:hypothetical protein